MYEESSGGLREKKLVKLKDQKIKENEKIKEKRSKFKCHDKNVQSLNNDELQSRFPETKNNYSRNQSRSKSLETNLKIYRKAYLKYSKIEDKTKKIKKPLLEFINSREESGISNEFKKNESKSKWFKKFDKINGTRDPNIYIKKIKRSLKISKQNCKIKKEKKEELRKYRKAVELEIENQKREERKKKKSRATCH